MLIYLLPGFNIGLFAYPLVEAIWGQEGLKHFGMFDMGNAIVLFGLCYILAGHFSSEEEKADFKSIAKKLIKSVPLVSYVLTLTLIWPDFVSRKSLWTYAEYWREPTCLCPCFCWAYILASPSIKLLEKHGKGFGHPLRYGSRYRHPFVLDPAFRPPV
ncbi:MAG: hypothetical protein ACOX3Q_04040 [Clostridia bacterium]